MLYKIGLYKIMPVSSTFMTYMYVYRDGHKNVNQNIFPL